MKKQFLIVLALFIILIPVSAFGNDDIIVIGEDTIVSESSVNEISVIEAPASAQASELSFSSMPTSDLLATINEIRAELLKRDLGIEPGQMFIDSDFGQMYLDNKNIELTERYLKIPVVLVNNTDHEVSFGTNDCSLNGWDSYVTIGNVGKNSKARNEIEISNKDAQVTSLDEIEDLTITFYLFDMNETCRLVTTETQYYVFENGELVRK